jgi:hypothetical protein
MITLPGRSIEMELSKYTVPPRKVAMIFPQKRPWRHNQPESCARLVDGDPVIEPYGRHDVQNALLGKLLDMVGGSLAHEHYFALGAVNLEVAHAFARASLNAAFELFLERGEFDDHVEPAPEFVAKRAVRHVFPGLTSRNTTVHAFLA